MKKKPLKKRLSIKELARVVSKLKKLYPLNAGKEYTFHVDMTPDQLREKGFRLGKDGVWRMMIDRKE